MQPGWVISGVGHLAIVAALLIGGMGRDTLPPVEVADVSVISESEFAALTASQPDAPEDAGIAPPVAPSDSADAPEAPSSDAAPPRAARTDVPPPAETDTADIERPEAPAPEAEVADDAPVIDAPPDFDDRLTPPDAAPEAAPRIAQEMAPKPPQPMDAAPEATPETAPSPDPDPEVVVEEEPPAAPEEATTQIVTEAEERPEIAPARSARPRGRPDRPEPEPERQVADAEGPAEEPRWTELEAAVRGALDDARAGAGQAADTSSAPTGPPLTGGERDALRMAVSRCWLVDPGSQAARVTVVVGVSLDQTGRIQGGVRQIEARGGSSAEQQAAFEKARRAVLRCQGDGYDLPADKYAQWREIEMTFNPEGLNF